MIKAQRGTLDILPKDSHKWQYIEKLAKDIAKLHNFSEIRTPTFEATELFLRGVGEGSDIVNKEMYTFLDKGERSISLKPEGTAGVVRANIENSVFADGLPVKQFYITPVFRYEKPQSGRLREHHQFGIELFGSNSPLAEAEVIVLAHQFFSKLGLKNVVVKINSLGSGECRKKYVEELKKYYSTHIDSLCSDCKVRFEKNILRVLDCKNPNCSHLKENAPKTLDYLDTDCNAHFEQLLAILKENEINYQVDTRIVRGIDYYTQTVFEFVVENGGETLTIGAGGRYDNLVKELGGADVCAVGFGVGIERILLLIEKQNLSLFKPEYVDCYIVKAGLNSNVDFTLAKTLRSAGISVETDLMNRSLRANFKYADKIKASFVLTIGEAELKDDVVNVKEMQSGVESKVKMLDLQKWLLKNKK